MLCMPGLDNRCAQFSYEAYCNDEFSQMPDIPGNAFGKYKKNHLDKKVKPGQY